MHGKPHIVVLIGMPAAGKTTVGTQLAVALGRRFVDLDAVIAQQTGREVADLLRRDGETALRLHEAEALDRVLADPTPTVLATGGGTPCFHDGLSRMRAVAQVVWLDAPLETLVERALQDGDRPLLGHTRLEQTVALRELANRRTQTYAQAHVRVDAGQPLAVVVRNLHLALEPQEELTISFENHTHPLILHAGQVSDAADTLARLGHGGKIALIVDRKVRAHAEPLQTMLEARGLPTVLLEVAGGEKSKDIRVVTRLWQELAAHAMDRGDVIVAIGGGAVTDLGGFVAATWLRGVRFVAMPTTVLAMADASVGGKTAIDLPQGPGQPHQPSQPGGKNLVGAFHPPVLVWLALGSLETLAIAEWRSGLAEIAKMALAFDAALWQDLLRDARALKRRSPEALRPHLLRAIELKSQVVARDPRETGERKLLNLGHTLGHALEAESGYTLRHGEAVALGLVAAAEVSVALGQAAPELAVQVRAGLQALDLPVHWESQTTPAAIARLAQDKKVRGTEVQFVALRDIGHAALFSCRRTDLAGMLSALAAANPHLPRSNIVRR